jgi:enabled protein
MEIPNLSLNSTFSVPLFEHQQHYEEEEVLPSSTMCNYTLYTKECGHKVEDHVENGDCPYFQRTQVPCDRDNSKIRDRWTVKDIPRNGICNNCLRDAHNSEEDAMRREQEKMRAQDLRDAEEKEAQLRRAQEELREKNWKENEEAKKQRRRAEEEVEAKRRADEQARKNKLATARAREETKVKAMEQTRLEAEAKEQEEFERAMRQSQAEHEANLAADIQEAERQSKAEIARQAKIREDEDYKFMVAKSLAEAERQRQQQEANEMARALRESAQFRAPPRNYQDEVVSLHLILTFRSFLRTVVLTMSL